MDEDLLGQRQGPGGGDVAGDLVSQSAESDATPKHDLRARFCAERTPREWVTGVRCLVCQPRPSLIRIPDGPSIPPEVRR